MIVRHQSYQQFHDLLFSLFHLDSQSFHRHQLVPYCSAVTPSPSQSTNVSHSSVVGQINLPSQCGHGPTATSASQNALQSTCSIQPNANPFYLRFIQGNGIQMCQGCKISFHLSDGSIPIPPFDVVIARAEQKTLCDKSRELVTPRQEQTCHYHFCVDCKKKSS